MRTALSRQRRSESRKANANRPDLSRAEGRFSVALTRSLRERLLFYTHWENEPTHNPSQPPSRRSGAMARREGGEGNWHCRFRAGWTLIESIAVLAVIAVLAAMAAPTYHVAIVRAREAVLRDDLYTLRKLIDQYTIDKQKPPQTLDDLVEAGYLRGGIPADPFTGRNDTWKTDTEDVPISEQTGPGLVDVHSGSEENSLDGTPYSSW